MGTKRLLVHRMRKSQLKIHRHIKEKGNLEKLILSRYTEVKSSRGEWGA